MAITYEDRFHFATKVEFQQAIAIAAVKVALDIQGEAEVGFTPEYFIKRHELANAIIHGSVGQGIPNYAKEFAFLVAATLTVPPQNPNNDQDIQDQVLSLWNDVAGVTQSDLA